VMDGFSLQVGPTPSRIIAVRPGRSWVVWVRNSDSVLTVRIAGSRETAPSGFSLPAGTAMDIHLPGNSDLWAVCSGGDAIVEVLA